MLKYVFAATLLVASLAASAAEPLQAMEHFYNEVNSLQADFVQTQHDDDGYELSRMEGVFLLKRPDQFRWEYKAPDEQIIVSNGELFKFYDVGLAQVTIQEATESLQATPAKLLTGDADLTQSFAVKDGQTKDGIAWLVLAPKADDSDFKRIRLGIKDQLPVVMELDDHLGQTTRIDFKNIRVNTTLNDAQFDIEIPDDATVVDSREG